MLVLPSELSQVLSEVEGMSESVAQEANTSDLAVITLSYNCLPQTYSTLSQVLNLYALVCFYLCNAGVFTAFHFQLGI